MQDIPIVSVEFSDEFELDNIPRLGAYSIADVFRGVKHRYPNFQSKILYFVRNNHQFNVVLNGEYYVSDIDELNILLPYQENIIRIEAVPVLQGDVGKAVLGVGLLVASVGFGVGILGLSVTSTMLLGASLVFSTVFKHPQSKGRSTEQETEEKVNTSVNFTGVINTIRSGQSLPLAFGQDVPLGSIVVSAEIVPHTMSVN